MHDKNPVTDRGVEIKFSGFLHPGILKLAESGPVLKAPDDGRRYLTGVVSGPREDSDGERMSEKCLKSFIAQWEERGLDLLPEHLRPDVQAIGLASPDLGPAYKAFITDREIKSENGTLLAAVGDLVMTFRLWDENDDPALPINEASVQWMKLNGLAPFYRKRKKGFSIEGYIPPGAYRQTETGPVIDDIDLVGVALTPWPSYSISDARSHTKSNYRHPVCKALGWKPEKREKDALTPYLTEQAYNDLDMDIEYAYDRAERDIKKRAFPKDGEERGELAELLADYAAALDALKARKLELFEQAYNSYKIEPTAAAAGKQEVKNMEDSNLAAFGQELIELGKRMLAAGSDNQEAGAQAAASAAAPPAEPPTPPPAAPPDEEETKTKATAEPDGDGAGNVDDANDTRIEKAIARHLGPMMEELKSINRAAAMFSEFSEGIAKEAGATKTEAAGAADRSPAQDDKARFKSVTTLPPELQAINEALQKMATSQQGGARVDPYAFVPSGAMFGTGLKSAIKGGN